MLLLKKIKFFILRQIDKAEIKLRKIFFSKEQKVFDKIYTKCKKKYNLKDDDGRNYSVFNLTSKIIKNNVPGSFVEAGVWKGAKIEVMIETLKSYKVLDRDIYLIDTFEGMTDPSDKDFHSITQRPTIKNKLKYTLDDVKKNILQLGYPEEKIHFIKIDVRDTELLKRNAYLNALHATELTIKLAGDFDFSSGKIIELEILRQADISEELSDARDFIDEILSGKYLVDKVIHQFTKDGYFMQTTIKKDSFITKQLREEPQDTT